MIAYLGWKRETEVEVEPIDLGCGAGEVPCFECLGTGDWTPFMPYEEQGVQHPCVACKGTGAILISI